MGTVRPKSPQKKQVGTPKKAIKTPKIAPSAPKFHEPANDDDDDDIEKDFSTKSMKSLKAKVPAQKATSIWPNWQNQKPTATNILTHAPKAPPKTNVKKESITPTTPKPPKQPAKTKAAAPSPSLGIAKSLSERHEKKIAAVPTPEKVKIRFTVQAEEDHDDEDEEPPINVGDIIDNQFKVIQILGQGGFGAVFKVLDKRTLKYAALKIELQEPEHDEPGLQLEIGVIRRMRHNVHFPKYIHHGRHKGLTYVVMQLLGDNLVFLRKKCPYRKFTMSTSVQLALQCLDCVEAFHNADLLHRDIKPENYCIGSLPSNKRTIYLLDFGLVRRYRMKSKIRPPRPYAHFRGTLDYASPRILCHLDAGRVDDVYSWFYIIMEFMCGALPWHSRDDNIEREELAEIKKKQIHELFPGLPAEVARIYKEILPLEYESPPPYARITAHLNQVMKRGKFKPTDPFDWEEGGAFYFTVFSKLEEKRRQLKLKKAEKLERSRCDEITMRTLDIDES